MNGATGSPNLTLSIAGFSRSAAFATSGLWNAPGDGELDRPPRALELGLPAAFVHRRGLSRHDELSGTVVVRRPDRADQLAELLDHFVLETEDRRHRARGLAGGLSRGQPTLAHERDRLWNGHRARGRQRGVLADRVPDDVVRLDSALAERGEDGEARGDEGGLLQLGRDQLLEGSVEAEPDQIEPGRLAAFLEDTHRSRFVLCDLPAHAGLERPLAREAKRDLAHLLLHSIKAEPQVRPAPMPVISTRSPSWSRPSACASASASGIEPDDVLPYRSTLTTTLSTGIPSFPTAWSMMRTFA